MKSLMTLWSRLHIEMVRSLGCASATPDRKTVRFRCEHEGLSFLTITLPAFGKDFERSLDAGRLDRSLFQGFTWKGGLPAFLQGFLGLVFHRDSGVLLDRPDPYAILCVRQLTLMFGKINLPCSNARVDDAFRAYIQCEKEVRQRDKSWTEAEMFRFRQMSRLLFGPALAKMDSDIYHGRYLPKHGPGSTADGLRGNAKFKNRIWTDRLESYFPAGEMLFYNWAFAQLDDVNHLEPGAEIPVKVITVPKTLKTPRIIAMEPTHMMYVQQALMEVVLQYLEGDDFLYETIGFDDQTPNQRLARQGSRKGDLATLDLSEASDRVSNQLVRAMVDRTPHLREALDATRSRKADVPGYGVQRLSKFASMGSALCFPMEAMVFTTIIFLGIQKKLRTSLTKRDVKSFRGKVRVFGDDLIVPKEYAHTVIEELENFGFRVNSGKSFWNGKFRESCGKEYFDGTDVSIARVRRLFPTSRQDGQEVISLVSLRNQLFKLGFDDTVRWLDSTIMDVLDYFPYVEESSPVLGRLSYEPVKGDRTDSALQIPLVRGYVPHYRLPVNSIDGADGLMKWALKRGDVPFADKDHLHRSGRPKSVYTKLGWYPAR